jgi:rubrerythrin
MAKTDENLKVAFAGESQANRKYLAFAKKADEEGQKQLQNCLEQQLKQKLSTL